MKQAKHCHHYIPRFIIHYKDTTKPGMNKKTGQTKFWPMPMLLIYVAQTNFIKKHNFPVQEQSLTINKHRETCMFMYHHNGVQKLILKDNGSFESSRNVQILGHNDKKNPNCIRKATSSLNSENFCFHSVKSLYFPSGRK
jgi:hypothetical protein